VDRACLDGITTLIAGLRLEPAAESLELTFGSGFQADLAIQAFSNDRAVPNLPLSYRYNRGTLPRTGTLTTNPDGLISIPLKGFEPQLTSSNLRVDIRLADALSDGHLEGAAAMLEGLALPSVDIPIRITKPSVCIESRESMYGSPLGANRLGVADAVAEALHQQGMQLTESCNEADLLLEIESDTERNGAAPGGFHTAYLNARVRVINNRTGDLVLQKNLDRVKGVQLDWESAGIAAYDKAGREIKGRFVNDLVESLFRN
jgi:hypothetical protein